MILDAHDFGGDPVATVRLPVRVLYGFHGGWVPDGLPHPAGRLMPKSMPGFGRRFLSFALRRVTEMTMRFTAPTDMDLRLTGISSTPVLCDGPEAEFSEELGEGGGLVVGVDAAGVGEDPGVAAAEGGLLEADAGVFDAGDDAVGADADEGDDGGAPAFDFGLEALAAGAKFVVGEFIGAGGGALDDVGDAEFEVEKEGFFKG